MKNNIKPILIISGLIIVTLIFIGVSALIDYLTPSTERQDLAEYCNITEDNQVAVSLNNELLEDTAVLIDGEIYLDFSFVYDNLNSRFYWDENENVLLYTTATDVISAKAESTGYNIGKATTDFGKVIVKATADSALINLEFVKMYSKMSSEVFTEPNRIVLGTATEALVADAKTNTVVRVKDHIKSPILSDIPKNGQLTVLEDGKKWSKVCTEDGLVGYVETNTITSAENKELLTDYKPEVFSHIKKDKPINLLWHQVGSASASSKAIANVLTKSKGVNVISPTWFKVADNSGNIKSIASNDYVKYCHEHNVEVWALISNFEVEGVSTTELLTHTSSRQNLVNQLVAKAVEYNLDGINVDFESMNGPEVRDAYIQFLRELSIKLHALDISLSTDVPVPAAYNDFYHYTEQANFVDYVILMAYDQHWGQTSGEGSVAALDWATEAVENMLEEGVPSDQLVLGIPFYTKLWILTPKTEENSAEINYLISFENLTMATAKDWMNKNVSNPEWLEDCGQYYGEVTKKGTIYKMWLEDITSLEGRLQLMQEQSLAGAAFWKSGLEFDNCWDLIIKYIN